MDRKKILDKFKNKAIRKPQLQLKDGSVVVGSEVDSENKLWYVIEKNGVISVDRAKGKKIAAILAKDPGGSIFVPVKKKDKLTKKDQ